MAKTIIRMNNTMKNDLDDMRIGRYREKLSHLRQYYTFSVKWYINDPDFLISPEEEGYRALFSVYHAIQLAIEAIIDISAMIVKDFGGNPLDNYKNLSFLQEQGIINSNIKTKLYKLIGLRNRITHDYNGLIDKIALDSYRENYEVIETFRSIIEQWVPKK